MSVYVKGMEMPDDCRDCPFENYYNSYGITKCFATGKAMAVNWRCIPWDGRAEWCPLVDVPKPHGRLIDADEFFNSIAEKERLLSFDHSGLYVDISEVNDVFKHIETVVEAEGE